jgi:hypothetical protein
MRHVINNSLNNFFIFSRIINVRQNNLTVTEFALLVCNLVAELHFIDHNVAYLLKSAIFRTRCNPTYRNYFKHFPDLPLCIAVKIALLHESHNYIELVSFVRLLHRALNINRNRV